MASEEKKLLLIVEDDPIYAEFVRSSLAAVLPQLRIRQAATLDQALAYIRGDPPFDDRSKYQMPAIILLDLVLARERGFPVLGFLRENGHLENEKVHVIILTASDRAEDIQQALHLGAISYLVKTPFASTITDLVWKFCNA
jgi:response regulator of citrate/malate metabolism